MKKNIIRALVFIMMSGSVLLANDKMILLVNIPTANVRSAPNTSAPIVARVAIGTQLEVTDMEGDWYEVIVNDQFGKAITGYIHNTMVEVLARKEDARKEKTRNAVRRELPGTRLARESGGGFKLMGGLSMGNLNFSNVFDPSLKKSSKTEFMGGLGFESGGRIAFEMDLLYSPGGGVLKAADPAVKSKISIAGTAITLPVMLKVRFLPVLTPYILAGGEIGYILAQKIVFTKEDKTTSEIDVADKINRLLYGVVFGAGCELQGWGMNLLLEARYRLGLSNQIKDPAAGAYIKTTALTFLLGIKF